MKINIFIDYEVCNGCGNCVAACDLDREGMLDVCVDCGADECSPDECEKGVKPILVKREGKVYVENLDQCFGVECSKCAMNCDLEAIKIIDEHMEARTSFTKELAKNARLVFQDN